MKLIGYKVLCHYSDTSILVSKLNRVYEYNFEKETLYLILKLDFGWKDLASTVFSILRRLLRRDVRLATMYNDRIYLVRSKEILIFNTASIYMEGRISIPRGPRPLNLSAISDIKGFDNGVYFGEYFTNASKSKVHIYRIEGSKLDILYTFQDSVINHIHNLIPDKENDCVWVLAGDFGNGAAIFRAKNNFKDVELIVEGSQQYRSCFGFPLNGGLVYCTDTQFETNHVRQLYFKDKKWVSEIITETNGPTIYGQSTKGGYCFSTSVEAVNEGSKLQIYLRNKRGPGVKRNVSTINKINTNLEVKELYSREKDIFPFVLFQFGNCLFPSGTNQTNYVFFTPIALKEKHFSTIKIKLDEV